MTKVINYHSFSYQSEDDVHLIEVEGVRIAGSEVDDGFFDLAVGYAFLFEVVGFDTCSKEAVVQGGFEMWVEQVFEVLESLLKLGV